MAHQTNLHTDDNTPVSLTRRENGRHWLTIGEWKEEVAIFLDDAMLAKIHAATAPEVVEPLTWEDVLNDPLLNEDAADNDDWDVEPWDVSEPYPENEDAFWGYARD